MPDVRALQSAVRFEGFELDLRTGELRRDGGNTIRLTEQPFRILVLLLERPQEVVTREELRKKLWPNDTIVEFEHSISAAMNRLRQALGDSAQDPRYIETLARRGYRWMVPVKRESFFPNSATSPGAGSISENFIGKKVSHYRVLELLGGGGMGVVYRAEDIKLGRRVALKFLPEELTKDPVALARFEREARSASALDHPNICAIHEFDEHDGQPFIVMPLLEGQTLRERIEATASQNTWVPLGELIEIAIQISEGLEAAHQKGIIHRDIKPANIFITVRGEAKILDFGLAKLRGSIQSDGTTPRAHDLQGPASKSGIEGRTSSADLALSKTGEAMGTASYMSPEQVRSEDLDGRTDLFSLGLVLYEMATSRQAFAANTAALLRDAILHRTPPSARALNPKLPLKLEEIINKCLEKERELRIQSAGELQAQLRHLGTEAESPPGDWVQQPKWSGLRLAVGAAIALLIGSAIWGYSRHHTEAALPPMEVVPLTGLSGSETDPAFSPDGSQVAFAFHENEKDGIYTTVVGGDKPLRLTHHESDCCPTWSPDGRQIAFSRDSEEGVAIYVIPALGGAEHRLYSGPSHYFPRTLHWSPDGKVIAFSQSDPDKTHASIALLSISDLTTRRLTFPSSEEVDTVPSFSPDGSYVAFIRNNVGGMVADLYVAPILGVGPKRLTFDGHSLSPKLSWTPDSQEIVFYSQQGGRAGLWRIPVSGGAAHPVAGIGPGAGYPSIALKGNQLLYQEGISRWGISRLDLRDNKHAAGSPVVVISGKGTNWRPNFSPDGKRIALESSRLGSSDIWSCDRDGSNCVQVTALHGIAGAPRWSPDGRYIAFEFHPKERTEIYVAEVSGGPPRMLATLPGADNGGPNWSRDGHWIYFYSNWGGGRFQLWKIPFLGGTPVQVTKNGGVFGAESGDGRFLYFVKFDQSGIWKIALQGGEEIRLVDQLGGLAWPDWALGASGIYFVGDSNRIQFFEFATGKIFPIYTPGKGIELGLALSPDGKSLLYVQREFRQSSIMLVKNFR